MGKDWYYSTFNDWMRGYSGEVIELTEEDLGLNDYQSEYTQKYNILREAGWKFYKGGRWMSPHNSHYYDGIDKAYTAQKMWEKLWRKVHEENE